MGRAASKPGGESSPTLSNVCNKAAIVHGTLPHAVLTQRLVLPSVRLPARFSGVKTEAQGQKGPTEDTTAYLPV